MTYKKITIFGRPGSGKSTFAYQLHRHLNIPVYYIDKIVFQSGWQEREREEYHQDLQSWINQDAWIIDGNGISSIQKRFPHTDIILYFRMPRALCYWRILKRYFHKDLRIQDRAEGCPEILWWKLIKYMWHFEKIFSATIEQCKKEYPHVPFYEITNKEGLSIIKKMFKLQ